MHDADAVTGPADRERYRSERRIVDRREGPVAAAASAEVADGWSVLVGFGSIAGYVAVDGELDPGPLLTSLAGRGARLHLPVLDGDALRFGPVDETTELVANRFGIPEPTGVDLVDGGDLDAVLVPLVAVDVRGNRLGFGAGFYDRTFAFLRSATRPARPLLVGLAHDLQVVDEIDPSPWDVHLDAVLTPTRRIGISVPVD